MENSQEILDLVYIQIGDLSCSKNKECLFNERGLSYAIGVEIPVVIQDVDEIFKECCYIHYVFADLSNPEDFRNDYSSFFHQRQLPNESVDFVLININSGEEYDLIDNSFGDFFNFGTFEKNTDLKGYVVKWRSVMSEIGTGAYKIIKRINISGIEIQIPSIVFNLRNFSTLNADKTTRIDVVMNGRLEKENVDFTGVNWKHSLRVPGFFGRREAQFEEDNIVNRQFEKRQISMKQTNEFKFQTNLIPDCLTNEVLDFILFANDIYFNDYNLNNHSYDFIKFGVKLASNDGTEYSAKTRKARLNLTFNDKYENNLKRNFK